jgi:two-component system, NtrC family, sensor histidine kinase HydH
VTFEGNDPADTETKETIQLHPDPQAGSARVTPNPWRIRGYDLIWLLLFGLFAWVAPHHDAPEIEILFLIAAVEIAVPRIAWFSTDVGAWMLIGCKLLLSYLFIGLTGGINSSFYLLLLLPIVSAAAMLRARETALVTLASGAAYLSFLLLLDPSQYVIPPQEVRELGIRVLFLLLGGFLTFQQAELTRINARRFQEAAQKLEQANASLVEAQAAVRRSDKLAALGQLTAGLAHELRNPLGTIRASADLLRSRSKSADETTQELAGYIISESDRTNSLVTRFLDFARPLRVSASTIDLATVLDESISQFSRHPAGTSVTVVKNYAPDVPLLEADGELLRMCFVNLLVNAAQASPAGATVTVKTRRLPAAAEISVIDRGKGISKENVESIFNPFFTTKTDGVGLGLPIVAKVVDEHGGSITVRSEEGQGTVFRIVLPLAKSQLDSV